MVDLNINTKEEKWQHILITGSHGYIGKNMKNFLQHESVVSSFGVDKKKGTYTEEVTDVSNYDGIIHLSAISGIAECESNRPQAYIDNILATINIMNAAYNQNVPLVFASSQAAKCPMNNFYAASKYIGECEAQRLNAKGANIKILRFANVFGGVGWENKTNVVARFRQAKESREPLTLNGDGGQKRDFICVRDICNAIWLALTCEETYSIPIDIGTGKSHSIKEVAEMFNHPIEYNKDSKLVGVDDNFADIRTAKELIGFESKYDISPYSIYKPFVRYNEDEVPADTIDITNESPY